MKNIKPLLTVLVTATVALAQSARADSAATIMNDPTGTGVTYDDGGTGNYPVVSAILSHPGSVDGYTYGNWSYLAQDTTGSLDMFYASSLTTGSAYTGTPGYAPVVGDSILVQGNYSPFDGIPEVANSASHPIAVTYGSSGNPLYSASPILTTIPTINVGTNVHALSLSGLGGDLLQLNGVTISTIAGTNNLPSANWLLHQNMTGTITDGSSSMTLFLWASSYSTCGAIAAGGGAVPTGPVNITGFISDFYNTSVSAIVPEFVPTSITPVPEPALMNLWGFGSALAFACYRLRKKA